MFMIHRNYKADMNTYNAFIIGTNFKREKIIETLFQKTILEVL